MEGYERKEGMDNDREEIYSKAVRKEPIFST